MATITIDKTWTDLADDYCFTSFNKLGEDIMNNMSLTTDQDFTFINRGSTTPSGSNQAYLWFNEADQRLYEYIGGVWCSKYPVPVGSAERRIWTSTEAALWAYDGGDGTDPGVLGNVSDTTGSFWEVDTAMSARMPLGVGALPSGTNVTVGGTGGEENHTLLVTEMPSHAHNAPSGSFMITSGGNDGGSGAGWRQDDLNSAATASTGGDPTDSYNTKAHNNLPPYYGVYFIKRTARIYYTSSGTAGATSAGGGVYFGSGAPAFTPVEGYGVYFDYTTRDMYVWSTTTSSWTL